MRYDKVIENGYIASCVCCFNGNEADGNITKEEYENISNILLSAPTASDGHAYRLKADLTWELYELPVVEEELTAEEALEIILGGEV